MSIVAGADFGTLSVRISIFDRVRGVLGRATAEYPLQRSAADPDFATQRHADQMDALARATREAVADAGIDGSEVKALALDTTGSSVIPVGTDLQSRSPTTTSGATTAPTRKPPRSPPPPTPTTTARASKASSGAAASTPPSGAGPSSSTGSATTPTPPALRHRA